MIRPRTRVDQAESSLTTSRCRSPEITSRRSSFDRGAYEAPSSYGSLRTDAGGAGNGSRVRAAATEPAYRPVDENHRTRRQLLWRQGRRSVPLDGGPEHAGACRLGARAKRAHRELPRQASAARMVQESDHGAVELPEGVDPLPRGRA